MSEAKLRDADVVMQRLVERAAQDARDVYSDHRDATDAINYMEQLLYAALRSLAGSPAHQNCGGAETGTAIPGDDVANPTGPAGSANRATRVVFGTPDPTVQLGGEPVSAMTTMLYRVCKNDQPLFDEAMRLVVLFVDEAIKQTEKAKS